MVFHQHKDKDDKELMDLFHKDGDNEWLGILLQRYTLLLFGVCMKYLKNEEEAKDSVQQIFLKVIDELKKYKVEYFKSWVYMVAKNHCLMKFREKGRFTSELNERVLSSVKEESDDFLQKEKSLTWMASAVEQLNPEQKACITLFYLEKKSYQQVSDQTGYTFMQVKSYIQNAKRNLRKQIERMQENEE